MELTAIINKINSFLWGVPLLILLLGGGIYLSIKLGFPQIHILKIMKKTVFTLFKKESSESDSLSQFQTFSTALAATVGTGSVRTALVFIGSFKGLENGACLLRKLSGSEML